MPKKGFLFQTNRRSFLRGLLVGASTVSGSSAILNNSKARFKKVYQFTAESKEKFEKHFSEKHKWENSKLIQKISDKYIKSEQLLSVTVEEDSSALTVNYVYIFNNRKSFVSWENEIDAHHSDRRMLSEGFSLKSFEYFI